MYNPIEALSLCFARMFSFTGRSSRSEFWWVHLFLGIFLFVAEFAFAFYLEDSLFLPIDSPLGEEIMFLCQILLYFIMSFMFLPLTVRRLHDIDVSAWWAIGYCIPFVSYLYFLIAILPGQENTNRFGANPLSNKRAHYDYYVKKPAFGFDGSYDKQEDKDNTVLNNVLRRAEKLNKAKQEQPQSTSPASTQNTATQAQVTSTAQPQEQNHTTPNSVASTNTDTEQTTDKLS